MVHRPVQGVPDATGDGNFGKRLVRDSLSTNPNISIRNHFQFAVIHEHERS
jgi:hypothetical protein